MKSINEFKSSLVNPEPPEELKPVLRAMWYDANGDWDTAHDIAKNIQTPDGNWVHAYLHRKEGDFSNARYWYGNASKNVSDRTVDEEWELITSRLLA